MAHTIVTKWLNRSLIVAVGSLGFTGSANATNWSDQDRLDGQCVAYYANIIGTTDAEKPESGVMAILGYFVGKIEGRHPGFDLAELLTPAFVIESEPSFTAIGARCDIEAGNLGSSLRAAGKVLMDAAAAAG